MEELVCISFCRLTFWDIFGGLPVSWTASSVAEILVYSDQHEAGKKGPVAHLPLWELLESLKDFRPALSFFVHMILWKVLLSAEPNCYLLQFK